MSDFAGKVYIVTGGAQGIGKAIAKVVLKEGGKVTISDINEQTLTGAATEFADEFGPDRVHHFVCDVSNEQQFAVLWDDAERHFGAPVYGLVNSAGVAPCQVGWKKTIQVNLVGTYVGCDLAFRRIGRSTGGSGGVVVNICSMAGLLPSPLNNAAAYHASKYGVLGLTRQLGQDNVLKADGVRVNCLCPSLVNTALGASVVEDNKLDLGPRALWMSPEVIGHAFRILIQSGRNGAALAVLEKDSPAYYMEDLVGLQIGFVVTVSKAFNWPYWLLTRRNMQVSHSWQQKLIVAVPFLLGCAGSLYALYLKMSK